MCATPDGSTHTRQRGDTEFLCPTYQLPKWYDIWPDYEETAGSGRVTVSSHSPAHMPQDGQKDIGLF
ncbi:unnamed protein product [Heligmosomoides polygyrus]|uniref:Tyrosine-protein phosphatase domain-containing protein n=1 Tax=Heligmosomoides polygyrus TaxID=6339 RepID=A0A183FE78_HELPZ|nr:unnamed protein product [Heligmosomoides polygyrus]